MAPNAGQDPVGTCVGSDDADVSLYPVGFSPVEAQWRRPVHNTVGVLANWQIINAAELSFGKDGAFVPYGFYEFSDGLIGLGFGTG